jgi:hypothetical protein
MDDVAPLRVKTAADVVGAFAAYCRGTSPTIAAKGVPSHEKLNLLGDIALIDAWCGRLVVLLSTEPAPAAGVR